MEPQQQPPIIPIPAHSHPLKYTNHKEGGYKNGWGCDYCSRTSPSPYRWNCYPCTFDLCTSCYMKDNILFLPTTHPHRLTLQDATAPGVYSKGYNCDKCATYNHSGFRMNCMACQFDLCMTCLGDEVSGEQPLKLSSHPHELSLDISALYCCNLCRKDNNTYNWVCSNCKFYICSTCFISEYEKMKQTRVVSDHEHPITLIPSRSLGTYQYGYRCDTCRRHVPTPLRWSCDPCKFDMCEECFNAANPPIIQATTANKTQDAAVDLEEDESNLCLVCQVEPRNATFVHQGTGHTVCCLPCANLVAKTKKGCPVCRRSIDVVIQNFFG